MTTQLLALWNRTRSSYWFVPSIMLFLAVGLSFLMIALDESIDPSQLDDVTWLYINEPEGARALLATVAGSMITVAGVTFSITIVALTLASSQFGPRLLRNFMRNPGNQIVLGTYIATFIYCLLILRNVRPIDEEAFIPHLSIALALVLTVISLGVLIYFIHHAAASIQIATILAEIGKELEANIELFYPEQLGHGPSPEEEVRLPAGFARGAQRLSGVRSGYIQTVNHDSLLELASRHDLLLKLHYQPGDFVVKGDTLLELWPVPPEAEALFDKLHSKFVIGDYRTQDQDPGFLFDQLVEVATRALSPGINDHFTALLAIDRIRAGLSFMTEREIPSAFRFDDDKLRVIAAPISFETAVKRSFGPIRRDGAANLQVVLRLFEVLAVVARRTTTEVNREVLRGEAERVRESALGALAIAEDRQEAARGYDEVMKVLKPEALEPGEVEPGVTSMEETERGETGRGETGGGRS